MLFLSPIAPARTGNGLAMRAHLLVTAAALDHDVHLVVVPIAGEPPFGADIPAGVVSAVTSPLPAGGRGYLEPWLAAPVWRERLRAASPLPPVGTLAPPAEVALAAPVRAVIGMRLGTAVMALAAGERGGVPLIVDADDDDVSLLEALGRPGEAAAWGRCAEL
ncbi:MAG TPA: hypothetical protein VKW77_11290, partial [Acidimicrobiales bacterium]|nr:hypothetical protein [Acidimicrobiales bacterium]